MASEARIIYLNTSLNLQEDSAPWNWRLRRTQVCFMFSQCSYLQTTF